MLSRLKVSTATLLAAAALTSSASAATLYSDNFERVTGINSAGFSYTGQGGLVANMHGFIDVNPDPTPPNTSAGVLSFTQTNSGGDTFTSAAFAVTPGETYTLSFDYYGELPTSPDPGANGNGGFIGLSDGFPGNHYWLAGTNLAFTGGGLNIVAVPIGTQLVDDDDWHSYSILFTPGAGVTNLHIMLEDFTLRPGDAYFDNLAINSVPLPASAWGGLSLLALLGAARIRSRRDALI
jgi:hypothetical protein